MQPPSSPLRPSGYSSTAFSSAFASHGGFAFTSTHHKQRCHRVDRGAVPLAQARSCVRSGNGGGQGALPRSPHEPPHAATGCSASTRGDSSAGAARSDAAKFSPPHHGQRRAAPPGNGQRRPPRAPLPALWRPLPAAPRRPAPCRPAAASRGARRGAYLPQHAGQPALSAPRRGAALSRPSRRGHAGGAARLRRGARLCAARRGKARLGTAARRPESLRAPPALSGGATARGARPLVRPPPAGRWGQQLRGGIPLRGGGGRAEWPRGRARIRPRRRSGASTPNAVLVYL